MIGDHWHHPACLEPAELLKSCRLGTGRSSGPGGQHRNKVETLVELTHLPSGVEAHAGERRSQVENKRVAIFRLRVALAIKVRTGVPAGEIGSALWRSRCKGGRIACNPEHQDFPSLLAEALDVIFAAGGGLDMPRAALRLGCTPSQLLKLVQDCPSAIEHLNRERVKAGLRALR